MNKKVVLLVVGILLAIVAVALVLSDSSHSAGSGDYTVPAPSTNPNDPAVKGLSIN